MKKPFAPPHRAGDGPGVEERAEPAFPRVAVGQGVEPLARQCRLRVEPGPRARRLGLLEPAVRVGHGVRRCVGRKALDEVRPGRLGVGVAVWLSRRRHAAQPTWQDRTSHRLTHPAQSKLPSPESHRDRRRAALTGAQPRPGRPRPRVRRGDRVLELAGRARRWCRAATIVAVLAALGVDASSDDAVQVARGAGRAAPVAAHRCRRWWSPRAGTTPWLPVHLPHGGSVQVWAELEGGGRRELAQQDHWVDPRVVDGAQVGEATFAVPADLPLGWHRARGAGRGVR